MFTIDVPSVSILCEARAEAEEIFEHCACNTALHHQMTTLTDEIKFDRFKSKYIKNKIYNRGYL
jgi:hypothetical protein